MNFHTWLTYILQQRTNKRDPPTGLCCAFGECHVLSVYVLPAAVIDQPGRVICPASPQH